MRDQQQNDDPLPQSCDLQVEILTEWLHSDAIAVPQVPNCNRWLRLRISAYVSAMWTSTDFIVAQASRDELTAELTLGRMSGVMMSFCFGLFHD